MNYLCQFKKFNMIECADLKKLPAKPKMLFYMPTIMIYLFIKDLHHLKKMFTLFDLHKSENGYKNITTHLNLDNSKKWALTRTVINLHGKGPRLIFPLLTLRRMVREPKHFRKGLLLSNYKTQVLDWNNSLTGSYLFLKT